MSRNPLAIFPVLLLGATSIDVTVTSGRRTPEEQAAAMRRVREPLPPSNYRHDGAGGMIWSPQPPKRCTACNGPANDWHDRCAACRAKKPIDWPCPQCNVKAGEPCRGGRGRQQRKELHAARVKVARGER